MSHNDRIHGKSASPYQLISKHRKGIVKEIPSQIPVSVIHRVYMQLYPVTPQGFQERPDKLQHSGKHRCQRGSGNPHGGNLPYAENKNPVQHNIRHHGNRAYHRALQGISAVFHDTQINLGNPHQKIRNPHDPQILGPLSDQVCVRGKNPHKRFRYKQSPQKEYQGYGRGEFQRNGKDLLHRHLMAFSPILGCQNRSANGQGCQKQTEYKLYLPCQGDCRQCLLTDHAQHNGVRGAHRCCHKILERNRQNQSKQLFIKYPLIIHRYPLPLSLPRIPGQILCLYNSIFYLPLLSYG